MLTSIQNRVKAWLAYLEENPSVKGMHALFSPQEVDQMTVYVPRWPLLVHLFAAIFQMTASSYYHLFLCESKERANFLQCMDFCGICIMICGSTTSPFYYGFMCEENWFWGQVYLV
mmetsp:Transcript_27326/g.36561  ORF Transcript_27326/g.36561 Transcript_27326/m.36561 type:complete len:116 (+) Transcript_27326:1013-1360(+)